MKVKDLDTGDIYKVLLWFHHDDGYRVTFAYGAGSLTVNFTHDGREKSLIREFQLING